MCLPAWVLLLHNPVFFVCFMTFFNISTVDTIPSYFQYCYGFVYLFDYIRGIGISKNVCSYCIYSFWNRWTDRETDYVIYTCMYAYVYVCIYPYSPICPKLFLVTKSITFWSSFIWCPPTLSYLFSFLLRQGLTIQPRMTTNLQSSHFSFLSQSYRCAKNVLLDSALVLVASEKTWWCGGEPGPRMEIVLFKTGFFNVFTSKGFISCFKEVDIFPHF